MRYLDDSRETRGGYYFFSFVLDPIKKPIILASPPHISGNVNKSAIGTLFQ